MCHNKGISWFLFFTALKVCPFNRYSVQTMGRKF